MVTSTKSILTQYSYALYYTYFAPPPRLWIDAKKCSRWLACFCILLSIIMHLLLFLSPDWLTFCHMIISCVNSLVFYLFSVSLWRRADARNVRLYYPYWQYTNLLYFDFYLYSAYAAHHVYIQQLYSHEFHVFGESTTDYTQVIIHLAITPSDKA